MRPLELGHFLRRAVLADTVPACPRAAEEANQLFDAWAAQNTKLCPTCSAKVEKNGGCDTVTCRCGTSFCYNCGLESAECRVSGCKAPVAGAEAAPGMEMTAAPAGDVPQLVAPAACEPTVVVSEAAAPVMAPVVGPQAMDLGESVRDDDDGAQVQSRGAPSAQ